MLVKEVLLTIKVKKRNILNEYIVRLSNHLFYPIQSSFARTRYSSSAALRSLSGIKSRRVKT